MPSVATIPAVVDKALTSSANPGSELATTGDAALLVLALVLVVGVYWYVAGDAVLIDEIDMMANS